MSNSTLGTLPKFLRSRTLINLKLVMTVISYLHLTKIFLLLLLYHPEPAQPNHCCKGENQTIATVRIVSAPLTPNTICIGKKELFVLDPNATILLPFKVKVAKPNQARVCMFLSKLLHFLSKFLHVFLAICLTKSSGSLALLI